MSEKLFYTMGEVTEMFDVNPSLLRYWESRFKQLQPKRNNKGNRLYRPEDVEFIKLLYHLLKERGMTIEGARKSLQERSADELSRESELFERLQYIRQLLVEVRETLMDDPDKTMAEEEAEAENEIGNGTETRNETGNGSRNRNGNSIGSRNRNGNKNGNSSEPQPVAEAPAGEAPLGLIVEPEKPLPAPVPKPEPEPDYASMPALVRPTEPDPEVIVVTDADLAGEFPTAAAPGTPAEKSAEVPANAPVNTPADAPIEQLAEIPAEVLAEDPAGTPVGRPSGTPAESSELPELKRRRRGRKEDAEPEKELFAFYEQRLF